ncbi:MAG: hypothetical protein WCF20_08845 [Methylovirgula sp.]
MLNMTEDFTRLAGDIVEQKWARLGFLHELPGSVRDRRTAVSQLLHDMRLAREQASRDMRDEMNASREERNADTHMYLERFKHQRSMLRQKLAANASAFMRDLTASVADYRAAFKAEHDCRAEELHKLFVALSARLEAYKNDRRRAIAAWRAGGYATQGSWLGASAKHEATKPHGGA